MTTQKDGYDKYMMVTMIHMTIVVTMIQNIFPGYFVNDMCLGMFEVV